MILVYFAVMWRNRHGRPVSPQEESYFLRGPEAAIEVFSLVQIVGAEMKRARIN